MKVKTILCAFVALAVVAMWSLTACTDSVTPDVAAVETPDVGRIISEETLGEEPREDVSEERASSGVTGQKAGTNQFEVGGNFNCKNRYKYSAYLKCNDTMTYSYAKSKPTVKKIETNYNFHGDDRFLNIPFVSDTTGLTKTVKFVMRWNGAGASPVQALEVTFVFKDDSRLTKKVNVVPTLLPQAEQPNNVFFGTQKFHLLSGEYPLLTGQTTIEPYGVTLERFGSSGEAITPSWIPKKGQLILFGEYKKGIIIQATLGTVAPNVGLWGIRFEEYNAKCSALKTIKEYFISPSLFKTMKSADGVSVATKFVQ